jgi:hypothetical protein
MKSDEQTVIEMATKIYAAVLVQGLYKYDNEKGATEKVFKHLRLWSISQARKLKAEVRNGETEG